MLTVLIDTNETFNLKSIIKHMKNLLWNLKDINSMKFQKDSSYRKEIHKYKR